MNSKLQGKIKKIDLKINKQLKHKLCNQHQVSFDKSCYVEAQTKNTDRWFKARILDCKFSKDYQATQKKSDQSFEYYVHYEPFDRRNDQWIPYSRIRKTNQKIQDHNQEDANTHTYIHPNDNPHLGMNHVELIAHQQYTKFKTVPRIQLGKYMSEAWYYSPYPIYYHNVDCLYICQFCLSFFSLAKELKRHSQSCPLYHPPGDEIYRDQEMNVAVFQVDGLKNPVYCENLAFMSKLFLDHKNLHYDMSIFLFYILCEIQNGQYHIAGYFSKEKQTQNNLSCILVLPFHQRKGFGKFLITFSYELSLLEHKVGGPEKPLSDMGKETYLSWWAQRIIDFIRQNKNTQFSLEEMSKRTAINEQDMKWTLQKIKIVKFINGIPQLCCDQKYMAEIYKSVGRSGLRVVTENIHFVPFKIKWDQPNIFL